MPQLSPARTGLDVGFDGAGIPECFAPLKGGAWRSIPGAKEFPFEDSQFEVVILSAAVVNLTTVKESHRVLKPDGMLYFIVPEKSARQDGFTMPEIYAIVREGYNIVGVERPKWWKFGLGGRTLTISARKKNWRSLSGATFRPYV